MKNLGTFIIGLVMTGSLSAQTWNQINVPTTEHLHDIDFPSESVGYISGDNGTLLKTTNGGQTWAQVNYTGINTPGAYAINDLEFVDELNGFLVVEDYGQLYKTSDGGSTWLLLDDAGMGNICYKTSLYASDVNNFFLGGAGCFQSAMIVEYNNGTWTQKNDELENFLPDEFVHEMDFLGNLGLAATHSQYMLRSTDFGQNWDTIPVPMTAPGELTSVLIVDNLLAYAGYDQNGSGFGIMKSEDGGLTWTEDFNSATFFYPAYLCVEKAANGDVYSGAIPSGGGGGLIFETVNGVDWSFEGVDQPIYSIASYGDDITFAVGDSGYVVVNADPGTLDLNRLEEDQFSIFPNPTNHNIAISFKETGLIGELAVVNMSGQIISTQKLTGTATQHVTLPEESGMYFIEIQCESGRITKKVVRN